MQFYLSLFKDSLVAWSEDRAPRMGAAIAYYVVFSLAPLLLIAIAVAGAAFGEQAAQGEIVGQIESTVGQPAAQSIEGMLKQASAPEGNVVMMIVGGIIVLLAASGVFAELQDALNTIFRVPPCQSDGIWATIRRRFLSFAMVLAIGFMLLVSLVISAGLSAVARFMTPESMPGGVYLWQGLELLVSIGFITLLFALIFRLLPDRWLRWRDVWVGAAVTALLFTIGKFLIGLYLGQAGVASTFGAAGSLVLLLAWVYYSSQILLLGAEFTRFYSIRTGGMQAEFEKDECANGAGLTPAKSGRRQRQKATV